MSSNLSLNVEQSRAAERMRYVLIVCYDFPRISSAGVIRIYQFAKRLPAFGWQPVILTAQSPDEKREDNIEISDGELPCPKITVTASRFAVPIHTDHCAAADAVRSNSGITRLARFATGFAVPDGKIGWLIPAVRRGVQIAREYPIQACFSASPRATAHFVAYRIARRLNIPWIADFALPWSDAYWLGNRPRLLKRIDRKLEKLIVRSAHRVTVAYPELGRRLGARYGQACADKISVIPTGFDEDLFREPEPLAQAKFTVVYPGNHFCEAGRDGEYFLRTIDEWLDAKPELQEHVEFVFIGKHDEKLFKCCTGGTAHVPSRVRPNDSLVSYVRREYGREPHSRQGVRVHAGRKTDPSPDRTRLPSSHLHGAVFQSLCLFARSHIGNPADTGDCTAAERSKNFSSHRCCSIGGQVLFHPWRRNDRPNF